MDYPHLTVDLDKLAFGLYALMRASSIGDCLRLGMFPSVIMEPFEQELKRKIPDEYLDKETLEYVNGREIRHEIEHAVCCKILELASDDGWCVV